MGLYQDALESTDGGVFTNLRDGSGTNITSTLVSAKQALDVNVANSISVGVVDEAAFTYGSSTYLPVGGAYNSSITALTSGQGGVVALTPSRSMHVALYDASGVVVGDTNAHGLFVKPGDGTNVQAYSATSEAFVQLRQGGNIANVNASNQLLTLEGNAGSILALMKPATGTLSQLAVSNASQTLLASNASRKGWSVQNDTNKIIYIAAGATATAGAYTVRLAANSFYESMDDRVYTGVLSCISVTGVTGNAIVTEYS